MRTTLVGLLPLIVAAAIFPLKVGLTLFWLRDRCGLSRAAALVGGRVFVQLCQGLLVGYGLRAADDAAGTRGADRVASGLILAVGVMWLLLGVVSYFRRAAPAQDEPGPWMTRLRSVSAPAAFGIGGLLAAFSTKHWVFTLSAIAVIDNGNLNRPAMVLAFLYFVVAAQSLILAPVLVAALAPETATRLLVTWQEWLSTHKRAISIVLSLVFGIWFVRDGVRGLLQHARDAGADGVIAVRIRGART